MNEAIYDKEFSPKVQELIELCKKHDTPFFMTFEFDENSVCTSSASNGHPLFMHLRALEQCKENNGVNVDRYIMWLMKEAGETGHSSCFLSQLGVPCVKEEPKTKDLTPKEEDLCVKLEAIKESEEV